MSTSSLRQRRRRDNESTHHEDEMEIFVQQFNRANVHGAWGHDYWGVRAFLCRAALLLLFATFIAWSILKWESRDSGSSSLLMSKDLPLLTIYPRTVSSSIIHQVEGKTELLVTDDNREAVNAIRTSIAMANNLRYNGKNNYRRKIRKGGVTGLLLGISNSISNLRDGPSSQEDNKKGFFPGEIILESFDDVKMRSYLAMHGGKCSNDQQHNHHVESGEYDASDNLAENTVLLQYDKLITSMTTAQDDHELLDALWNRAFQLFTWCQFANGDARGYIAHGTSPPVADSSLQQMLEEARLTGFGMAVKDIHDTSSQAMEYDSVHYAPLLIMPFGAASRDLSREILQSRFLEEAVSSIISSVVGSKSLLFGISEEWLQKWNPIQKETVGISNGKELDDTYLEATLFSLDG